MGSVTRHPIARPNIVHPLTDVKNGARIAVAQRQRLVELAKHGLQRRHQAVGAHLIEHLPDLVRLLPGFLDQIRLTELEKHLLRSRRDQGGLRPDQHLPLTHLRAGNGR